MHLASRSLGSKRVVPILDALRSVNAKGQGTGRLEDDLGVALAVRVRMRDANDFRTVRHAPALPDEKFFLKLA
jgi:hypothetical protein